MIIINQKADFSKVAIDTIEIPFDPEHMNPYAKSILANYSRELTTAQLKAFNSFITVIYGCGAWDKVQGAFFPELASNITEAMLNIATNDTPSLASSGVSLLNHGITNQYSESTPRVVVSNLKNTIIKADVFVLTNVSEISGNKVMFATSGGGTYLCPAPDNGSNNILLNDSSNKVFGLPWRTTGVHLENIHVSPSVSGEAVTQSNIEYFYDGQRKTIAIVGSPIHKDFTWITIGNGLAVTNNACAYPNSILSLLIFSELTSEERTSVESAMLEYKSNFFG